MSKTCVGCPARKRKEKAASKESVEINKNFYFIFFIKINQLQGQWFSVVAVKLFMLNLSWKNLIETMLLLIISSQVHLFINFGQNTTCASCCRDFFSTFVLTKIVCFDYCVLGKVRFIMALLQQCCRWLQSIGIKLYFSCFFFFLLCNLLGWTFNSNTLLIHDKTKKQLMYFFKKNI